MVSNEFLVIFFTNNYICFINNFISYWYNIRDKVESLNGLFHIVDFTTDKIVMMADKVVDGVTTFISRIFTKNKNKSIEEENKNE